jgi:hypothetical protein
MKHIDPALLSSAARFVGRKMTFDQMTFDGHRTFDNMGNQQGKPLGGSFRTHDGLANLTVDGVKGRFATVDSTGAFLVGELERLDQTMHPPLAAVTWGRDVDVREDVTVADEVSSFTVSTFASAGGLGMTQGATGGKAWIGKDTNQISGIGLDIGKVTQPLRPWSLEIKYTIFELESAARLGRPIDAQKYAGLQLKHQMDIDAQVYVGDSETGDYGLVNSNNRTTSDAVTAVSNVPAGAQGGTTWVTKTPQEILSDFNTALTSCWANAAWAVMPRNILIPPAQFGFISTENVSQAGNISILRYLLENNLLTASGRGTINIEPLKWCIGAGVGGTLTTLGTVDRMVVYSKEKDYVRYPITALARTPVQYDAIYQKASYYNRLGVLEIVYPETFLYADGI